MLRPSFCCASMGDQGGSAYYRLVLPLLMANAKGYIQARMPNKMFLFPLGQLETLKPDTLVLHRSHTEAQRGYINEVKHKTSIMLVYTIDDWVGKIPKESPHYQTGVTALEKDTKKAISLCDRLIVTNDLLANVYGYKKEVAIIPNYLSEAVWDGVYRAPQIPRNRNKPRIGWSGGMGHPGDLKILKEIADILGDQVQWVFLGDAVAGFDQGNSEMHQPVMPTQYAYALYSLQLDLALAPLLDNDFNRAKSSLRLLEYGACGYPIIASNIKPYADCDAPITLMEHKAAWWAQEILQKLEDRVALAQEGRDLKDWVWKNYKLEDHLQEYGDILAPDGKSFIPTRLETPSDTIDVIITTHNHKEIVKNCVDSVLKSLPENKTKVNVIIADDASDEIGFKDYLRELKDQGCIVIEHQTNVGYIENINSACQLNPNNDIITLNSDTIVDKDWVDRLKTAAYSEDNIASATPWGNRATLMSYPNPEVNGIELVPDSVGFYNDVAHGLTATEYPKIPTPVGFCALLKRQVIAEIGLFDQNAFGRGYGEENDWAMRALVRGHSHILVYDTYVGHVGEVSFGAEKQQLVTNAAHVIVSRWPTYSKLLQQWLDTNPLRDLRQQMDIEAIKTKTTGSRTLYISHGYGGGLETYVQGQIRKDPAAIILRNNPRQLGIITLEFPNETYYNLPIIDTRLSQIGYLRDTFQKFGVSHISVQTTFGYDYTMPYWIKNLANLLEVDYSVMLHDYLTVCPRLRLVQHITYCGEPEVEECNKCVATYGSGVGQVEVGAYREMYKEFLYSASAVYAPSKDVATRVEKYYPELYIKVVPHEQDIVIGGLQGCCKVWDGKEPLHVAVLGLLTPDKGSLVVHQCAEYCRLNNIPVKFTVFGEIVDLLAEGRAIKLQPSSNLSILGVYKEEDIGNLLRSNQCHCSLFPSLCPETYSYTLSHAFRAGLWPFAFDIGAPRDRIKEMNFGTILPYNYHSLPGIIVNSMLEAMHKRSNYIEQKYDKAV